MKTFAAVVVAVSVRCFSTDATIPGFAQTKLTPGSAALLIEPQGLADLNRLRDGILNRISGETGRRFSRSAQPKPSAHTMSPPTPTATDIPGIFCSVTPARTI